MLCVCVGDVMDFIFSVCIEGIMEVACSSRSLQDNKINSLSQVVY